VAANSADCQTSREAATIVGGGLKARFSGGDDALFVAVGAKLPAHDAARRHTVSEL
jgi:hypothetical protein